MAKPRTALISPLAAVALWLVAIPVAAARPLDAQTLGFGAGAEVGPTGAPLIAGLISGAATAVAATSRGSLTWARAAPGLPFAPSRLIAGTRDAGGAALAQTSASTAALAFSQNDHSVIAPTYSREPDCCERLHAVVLGAHGHRSPVRTLSAAGRDAGPVVAGQVAGRSVVAFVDRRGLRVATGTVHSGFQASRDLGKTGRGTRLLAVWLAGRNPHVLSVIGPGDRGFAAVETFRRRGRVLRVLRAKGFAAESFESGVATAPGGRVLAAFAETYARSGRLTVLERDRRGRVRISHLAKRAQFGGVAVALDPAGRGWIARSSGRDVVVSRLGGGPRSVVRLWPGVRENASPPPATAKPPAAVKPPPIPGEIGLAVDARGRGVLADVKGNYVGGRGLIARLAPGGRLGRLLTPVPLGSDYEPGVTALQARSGDARVVFGGHEVVAVRVPR